MIQEVVEESRDVMEASAPLLESSQPSLGEEEGQSEDGDQGGKGSCESVGSGSSFEELDMEVEVEEEKEEKKNEAEEEDHNGQQKPMMVGETIGNREEWRIKQIRGSVGEWWVHMWVWVHVWKGESLSVSLKSSKAFFFFLRLWN